VTPGERDFGILIGKVDALADQVAELKRTNTAEHKANGERLERLETGIRVSLDSKASETWVKEHESRLTSLEGTRTKGEGAAHLVKGMQGLVFFLLALAGFLLTRGVFG
jgi:hypothetical protein